MGFRENLKEELKYQDIKVKELSAMTGIPKGTLDHYLAEKCTVPPADAAVKIANALNVSVEKLVAETPGESKDHKIKSSVEHLALKIDRLSDADRRLVELLVERLQDSRQPA